MLAGFPVVVRFPMHWGDMDALGHANNIMYFRWFESARIAYFTRSTIVCDKPTGIGPILATTTCDYVRPLTFPADIMVGAKVSKVGNTSFTMEYAIVRENDPATLYARGSGVVVLVNYDTGEKCRIPDEIRLAIAELEKGTTADGV